MKRTLMMMALTGALGAAAGIVACGGDTTTTPSGSSDVTMADGTSKVQFAVTSLKLPLSRDSYSIDLDGDNKNDNALNNIVSVLAGQGLDTQDGVDKSIKNGDVVILFEAQGKDTTLTADDAMGVTLYIGKSMPATCQPGDGGACTGGPDFNGMGMFTVDSGIQPAQFFGKLAGGKFSSNNPVTTSHPVSLQLKLAIVSGAPAITLATNGAHVQFTASGGKIGATCGSSGDQACGSLQGSVKISDLQGSVIPAVAGFLTDKIKNSPPGDSTAKSIQMLFDTGGCGSAKAMDGIIDVCELQGNSIIMNLLSADVQVFDDAGNYKPNPAKTKKDSLSLGVGFTAVGAKF